MAVAITYKTVISDAINSFNGIQDALSVLQAKYGDKLITSTTAANNSLVPTGKLSGIILDQTQLIPNQSYTIPTSLSFNTDTYTIDLKTSSHTGTSGENSVKTVTYSSVVIPKAKYSASLSLTPGSTTISSDGVSNDYFSSTQTNFSISAYGTVSASGTAKITNTGWISSGDILSSSPSENSTKATKYLKEGSFSVSGGGLTAYGDTSSITVSISKATNENSVNTTLFSTNNFQDSVPTSGAYIALNSAGSGTFKVTRAATTTSISSEGYIKDGKTNTPSIKEESKSFDFSKASGNGTKYISLVESSGGVLGIGTKLITPTLSAETVAAEGFSSALVEDKVTTAPTENKGYYIPIKSTSSSGSSKISVTEINAGYNKGKNEQTGTVSVNSNNITTYFKIKASQITSNPITNTTDTNYKDYTNIALSNGYLYLSEGLIPEKIKISLGDLIPDIENDAADSNILSGYKAYNEDGELITGSMPNHDGEQITVTPSISGLTISNSGNLGTGYYNGNTISGSITLNSLTVPSGSTLGSITNNGTVTSLANNGTITTLTNNGTITIKNGTSSSTNKSITFENATIGDTTITDSSGNLKITGLHLTGGAIEGVVSITSNSMPPSAKGGNAVISDTAPSGNYVIVNATGSASRKVITHSESYSGWFSATSGNTAFAGSGDTALTGDSGYIPAEISPTLTPTINKNSISTNLTSIGAATTFNSTTGAISSSSHSATQTITVTNQSNALTGQYKDKYIVGGIAVGINGNSKDTTINVDGNATGSTVDDYLESLYKRMLGQSYTAVKGDSE